MSEPFVKGLTYMALWRLHRWLIRQSKTDWACPSTKFELRVWPHTVLIYIMPWSHLHVKSSGKSVSGKTGHAKDANVEEKNGKVQHSYFRLQKFAKHARGFVNCSRGFVSCSRGFVNCSREPFLNRREFHVWNCLRTFPASREQYWRRFRTPRMLGELLEP